MPAHDAGTVPARRPSGVLSDRAHTCALAYQNHCNPAGRGCLMCDTINSGRTDVPPSTRPAPDSGPLTTESEQVKILFAAVFAAAYPIVCQYPALADNHPFTITNNGLHIVAHIYVSSPDSNRWGRDLLVGYLDPGHYWATTLYYNCEEDIRIEWYDGHTGERRSFDTCSYDLNLSY
jgi:hypothetical protein